MTLTYEFVRRARIGAVASALAFVLAGGTAFAQAVQGYGDGQNAGSATWEGQGTRGGTQVDGAGPGGPRTKQLEIPYNNRATNPGVAEVPPAATTYPEGPPTNPRYGYPQGTQYPNEYPPAR